MPTELENSSEMFPTEDGGYNAGTITAAPGGTAGAPTIVVTNGTAPSPLPYTSAELRWRLSSGGTVSSQAVNGSHAGTITLAPSATPRSFDVWRRVIWGGLTLETLVATVNIPGTGGTGTTPTTPTLTAAAGVTMPPSNIVLTVT